MTDLADFWRFAEHDADALRAFEQLDDHRRAADDVDHVVGARDVVGESGHRQADARRVPGSATSAACRATGRSPPTR